MSRVFYHRDDILIYDLSEELHQSVYLDLASYQMFLYDLFDIFHA